MAALNASVEKAREARDNHGSEAEVHELPEPKKKAPAKKTAAKKTTAKKAAAKKTSSHKPRSA
ncbi:hypothetical protein [Streptomyces sp. NPDC014006]|uniref:hypothetical protein n=1 Tax=Streptomyces sp. NPDC014006 TaxID=3364870 RepID=UPI0036F9637A